MKRRDWWLGIALVAAAVLLHAAIPRYDWRQSGFVFFRIDRWTGVAERGRFNGAGNWTSDAARFKTDRREAEQLVERARMQKLADDAAIAESIAERARTQKLADNALITEIDAAIQEKPAAGRFRAKDIDTATSTAADPFAPYVVAPAIDAAIAEGAKPPPSVGADVTHLMRDAPPKRNGK